MPAPYRVNKHAKPFVQPTWTVSVLTPRACSDPLDHFERIAQLLEVARAELPAEYYAKAVPVITPRVYRLAKLTNKSEVVLLPGEATV